MNPNSMCVVENEVLRARLKRNKIGGLGSIRSSGYLEKNRDAEVLEKLNEIINGK